MNPDRATHLLMRRNEKIRTGSAKYKSHRATHSAWPMDHKGTQAMLTPAEVGDLPTRPAQVPYRTRALKPTATDYLLNFGDKVKIFGPNQPLFRQGDPSDYIFKVTRGAVRTFALFDDGHRKIESFRLPSDIFGLDSSERREFSAEAIGIVAVVALRRHSIMQKAASDCRHLQELWAVTTEELLRVQQHALLLSKTAPQRIASFLLEMSRRLRQTDILELPMGRQDIADYLGLTIETVSRALSQLEAAGVIAARLSRHIVLRDLGTLRRIDKRGFSVR
jgi:CRP/FNR family nitrogen fixation transcriptional regulator